ncbi:MAG: peptidoglycan-associated lipoprotein [Rhodospirillales bacterium 20-60-12]|nr:MAG: peptidoglycan-associated lipoprotein [Rhodospirillales bacterium 20-60-12]HQT67746.1 OmpA family protein [Acetobacteraceae bacterium]
MKFKAFGALAAVALLAACSSTPTATTNTSGSGAMATNTGAAPGSEQDLVANVGDRVFFAFNKKALSSDATATLSKQAAWLAKYPNVDVLVAGNADERGTETYNLALGKRRANAARDYLVAQGVAASRIQTTSYGKSCPVDPGNTPEAYAQNRNAITSVQGFNPQTCH